MAKAKTKAALEAENYVLKQQVKSDRWSVTITHAVKWGALFGIVSKISSVGVALAGHHTVADIAVKVLAHTSVPSALGIIFGSGGIVYGKRQEILKRKTVQRLETRMKEFEKSFDPKRSSSKLTTQGETNPEDIR